MDLIPFNDKYLPTGQGFVNLGATCYFNSILQCLLSCTSIYQTLHEIRDKPHVKCNKLAVNLLKLYDSALLGKSIHDKCVPVWQNIIDISQRQNNHIRMDTGQQDAHEGLMMFLDAMETIPEVLHLFEHRHRIQILCGVCKKITINKKEINLVFEVQPELKNDQLEEFKNIDEFYGSSTDLNSFLRKQNDYVEDHVCSICKTKSSKFKSTTLTMVPEILPVVFKKYYKKTLTPFPDILEFATKGQPFKYIYKLVAQSEHSGGMGGGHYWAIARRADGWKLLNDSSVSNMDAGPTKNTYIVFYHYIKTTNQ